MPAVLTENAEKILKQRYLTNGESVDGLWDRVSGGNQKFRKLLSELRFLPNSPALFNAGLHNGCTLSACFVFDVDDTMFDSPSGIHHTRGKAIAVAKAGGGVGYYFGKLRPKGSFIRSVHRKACGPVAVLRDYHGIRQMITQGGKRDLAQMGVLPVWHDDIREFIHCKDDDPRSLESFNISVGWTDEALRDSIGESRYKKLWDEQCLSAWKTGCPGMFFLDTVNLANPNKHLGLINAPNPCGETPNRSDEPCSLGSLVLSRYYSHANRDIDWNRLEEDTWTSLEFMDDILDRNVFPHPDITGAALLTRKLGLGVMGWADLLAMMHVHYDTEEAVNFGSKVMKFINEVALRASQDLAKKKGPYAGYSDKTEGPFARNETRTSIAPTGTIAIIAGCRSWSIEPHYGLDVERTTFEGIKMREVVDFDGFTPKVASEIGLEWHVRMQATFQKHTDLGVSKTINLPKSATVEDVSKAYRLMHELGCKGGTVFRDGCREEQVLVVKGKSSVYSLPRRRLPNEREGRTHKFKISGIKGYVTANTFEDGSLAEIFLRVSKQGSTVAGMLDTWAMCFSTALQGGKSLEELIHLHTGSRFEPCGPTDNKEIPICTSIPDYVVRWLSLRFLKRQPASGDSGTFCPDCGSPALYSAGCLTCSRKDCGWSRCG